MHRAVAPSRLALICTAQLDTTMLVEMVEANQAGSPSHLITNEFVTGAWQMACSLCALVSAKDPQEAWDRREKLYVRSKGEARALVEWERAQRMGGARYHRCMTEAPELRLT